MTILNQLTAICLGAAIAATPAVARNAVIALPSNLPLAEKESLAKQTVQHVLSTVEPGERAVFIDASSTHVIGVFEVPDDPRYANPRAKAARNGNVLRAVKAYWEAPGANESGQVDIPAVLNTVMETRPGGDEAAVILFADPRSMTALAPSVSMGGGALPNDGHLAATLSWSPYGTSGLRGSLQGYEVYFGITTPDWAISQAHAQGVARFWQASVEARGGSFQMMSEDIATVLARSGAPGVAADPVPLVVTTKLEMIQFQPDTGQVLDIYGVQPSPEPAPAPLWAAARDVSVGLSWDCTTCDLDLYLRPNPAAEVIFFGQAQTAQGQLFKDHLSSPSLTNGYETIALNGVVDLSQMQIAVNHYGGQAAGPITGELRIAIGRQVWARTLTLPAGAGNGGDGAEAALVERVVPNAAWVLVDPMAVLDGS